MIAVVLASLRGAVKRCKNPTLFLGAFPRFATLISLSSIDDDRVFCHLDHLVEDLVEFRLVRIADFTVVSDFDDRLTCRLSECRLFQIGEHKSNRLDIVGRASSIDYQRLFFGCLCRFHRIFHTIKPLLVIAIVTCRTNLHVTLECLVSLSWI